MYNKQTCNTTENAVKPEGQDYTNCSWCTRNDSQETGEELEISGKFQRIHDSNTEIH